MMKGPIVHIIPTLQNGGAETVLARLVNEFSGIKIDQIVITLEGDDTDFNHQKVNQFAKVIHLKQSDFNVVQWLDNNPEAKVIAWMYKSIIKAHLWASKSKASPDIYWNIRNSNFRYFQLFQRISLYGFGILSRFLQPHIIYCSHQAKKVHERYFFSRQSQSVIPNRWAKIKEDLPEISQPSTPTFLYVGRFDPMKGPKRLIRLFKEFAKNHPNVQLHIAGRGWTNKHISESIKDKVTLLGNTPDIYEHYASASALLFTSYSEGYPNVLVEAMVSGLPIVAFEAGDSKLILKDYPFGHTLTSNASFIDTMGKMTTHPYPLHTRIAELSIQKEKLNFKKTAMEYHAFLLKN